MGVNTSVAVSVCVGVKVGVWGVTVRDGSGDGRRLFSEMAVCVSPASTVCATAAVLATLVS